MMQPVSGLPSAPAGESRVAAATAGERPLSVRQQAVLERLITRLATLTRQQNTQVVTLVKQDLGLKPDAPLLARHFLAAEQNLTRRLVSARQYHSPRQTFSPLTQQQRQHDSHQTVNPFIRRQYGPGTDQRPGRTAENAPSPRASDPAFQRVIADRPLLPAGHNTPEQQVNKLVAATGESARLIWQSMRKLCGVSQHEPIPARYFSLLTLWLQARQTLDTRNAPTLDTLQAALAPPPDAQEWNSIRDYAWQNWQATPQTVLSGAQARELLDQIVIGRAGQADNPPETHPVQPVFSPLTPVIGAVKQMSAHPGIALLALLVAVLIFWLVI